MPPPTDIAEALIDWLERDRIQCALIAARPDLKDALVLEDARPMIKVPHPGGGFVLVAKTAEGEATQWVVGIPGRPEPTLHEPGSDQEIVQIVLAELDRPARHRRDDPDPERQRA